MRLTSLLQCAALSITVAMPVLAQDTDSLSAPKDCLKAARMVAKGHPARKMERAYAVLMSCPRESVAVYKDVFADLRNSSDTAALTWLVNNATVWRDGELFATAQSLATDVEATPEARAYGLLTVERLIDRDRYHPILFPDASINAGDVTPKYCRVTSDQGYTQEEGSTPLPADAKQQLRALAARLAADPATPPLVRRSAACM